MQSVRESQRSAPVGVMPSSSTSSRCHIPVSHSSFKRGLGAGTGLPGLRLRRCEALERGPSLRARCLQDMHQIKSTTRLSTENSPRYSHRTFSGEHRRQHPPSRPGGAQEVFKGTSSQSRARNPSLGFWPTIIDTTGHLHGAKMRLFRSPHAALASASASRGKEAVKALTGHLALVCYERGFPGLRVQEGGRAEAEAEEQRPQSG